MGKLCKNPECDNEFSPYTTLQKGCSPYCEREIKRLKDLEKGKNSQAAKSVNRTWSNINPVAPKRAKELAIYRPLRDKYMEENPICECCKEKPSSELHHRKGRMGELVYYVLFFMACCTWCHKKIHAESAWSYLKGYLISK